MHLYSLFFFFFTAEAGLGYVQNVCLLVCLLLLLLSFQLCVNPVLLNTKPSSHMTSIQRRINVETTLYKRRVPAGKMNT